MAVDDEIHPSDERTGAGGDPLAGAADVAGAAVPAGTEEQTPEVAPDAVGPSSTGSGAALSSLAAAIEALDEYLALDCGDPTEIEELFELRNRFEARVAVWAALFEESGQWATDTAPSCGAWLARHCRLSRSLAHRALRLGRALRRLPVVKAALYDGEISVPQAELIASLDTEATRATLERDEEVLVEQAKRLSVADLGRATRHWAMLADPDGTEEAAARRAERRDVRLSATFDGSFYGTINLDPISGEIVHDELGRIAQQLFEDDWAEAKQRVGLEPLAGDLARTSAQRRADALVEMAARSAAARVGSPFPVPLFNVMIGPDAFSRICELASGAPTTPGALIRFLEHAEVERAVWAGAKRVDVGVRTRFFTGATRRAVELRDRRCCDPYCDVPASRCEVDHVVAYTDGGETTQENGQLLCKFHNRLKEWRRVRRQRAGPDGGRAGS